MQPLSDCNSSLVVLIETQDRDWSFLYDIVNETEIRLSSEPHSHPIPYGTEITDHVRRKMDEITLTGVVGCLRCGEGRKPISGIIPELKRLSERMMYCKEDFVLLTSNNWQARHMILVGVTVREQQNAVQVMDITTNWVGANLTGTIRNPDFKRGGIVH